MPTQSLDHLILFVPADPTTNLPLVPPIFTQNFTLTPGGFHADGATSNVLILLADGCYIELISFITPSLAPAHWWGPSATFTGWKDWCLTNALAPGENAAAVRGSHAEPVFGGRKRADGVDVKWAVTFPGGEKGGQAGRGRVPFFCHDVTERGVRVPLSEEKAAHASGVLGVRGLTVLVRDQGLLEETRGVYRGLFGEEGVEKDGQVTFTVGRVQDVESLEGGARIRLRVARGEEEGRKVEEKGYWFGDVVFGAKAREGKAVGEIERLDDAEGENSLGGLLIEYV
ncbi:hypothetical protein IQ07DRAFT_318219 [Pyrenochaeta sp. DS3sAY3a]|nr:hypothetical protein IQ07DRAFT_318219 [Pyrenochaeta sp. DS3sAY3a]